MLNKCIRYISKSNFDGLKELLGFDDEVFEGSDDYLITSNMEDINQKSKKGVIPIHLACKIQDFDILRLLLRCEDLDVNIRDPNNSFTPVITLINNGGDIECLNLILKRSPNLDLCDEEFGDSPLHWAVRLELPKVIHRLVKSGMNVNLPNHKTGQTPLHLAISIGNEEVIMELIGLSANPILNDDNDLERNSILHLCILENIPNIALYIFNSATEYQKEIMRKSVDRNGNTALHLAYMYGMIGLAEFLISNGFDKNALNDQNLSPLDLKLEYQENNRKESKEDNKISQNKYEKSDVRQRRVNKIQEEIYETPVSEFLVKYNIAEKPNLIINSDDEENSNKVLGKHDFVFKLFYKKGYYYLDSSFINLTFNDLTNIGIKDKNLKELILQSLSKEAELNQEKIQELNEQQQEQKRKRNIGHSLMAISTCIFIFFTMYIVLSALARNKQLPTNASKKSRNYPSSYTKYKARYDI
ncbi:ankyrin repeat having a transmembrane domain [Cryptosporidium sp. chipmunk genotype I]|uniref:ankyrin repeat having a transmembrane domain n=1 Tax=Cryptosporidium sp. chipmunk genotype I TaxID=1280935 RepID=UPI00351A3E88|nr:ankyrin repeat having a transmembrane domain [Cryptosporidium sp. chipmunk genotype I]